MKIGVPREIKPQETRVAITPTGVLLLTGAGHQVLVQQGAGASVGFDDEAYSEAGAEIVADAAAIYRAEMIVKVKEPQIQEFSLLHAGQVLFSYLHLAPDPRQTKRLLERKVIGIAYETVTDSAGQLPLLAPMSEIAGRIAVQAGATALQMEGGGRGVLLGGVPGVEPGRVVVIGGGVVGLQAARMALGLGADVTLLDRDLRRLRCLDDAFGPRLKTCFSDPASITRLTAGADLVIGAVLVPGHRTPKLIDRARVRAMRSGSVFVDVAIDQGGCAETSRPTTHQDPTYVVDDVVHYCVANIPSACGRTATLALTNATLPYVMRLADLGFKDGLASDPGLLRGLNLHLGRVTNEGVSEAQGLEFIPPDQALG